MRKEPAANHFKVGDVVRVVGKCRGFEGRIGTVTDLWPDKAVQISFEADYVLFYDKESLELITEARSWA